MRLWRIVAETRRYRANDLSGGGAAKNPGRWNKTGEPVLYTATTIALAVLETAAHVDDLGLPLNRFIVAIDVPDALWANRKATHPGQLPRAWNAIPPGQASARFGSRWLAEGRSAVAELPLAIVPEESIALINPRHPDAGLIQAQVLRLFEYNRLFRSAGGLPPKGDKGS